MPCKKYSICFFMIVFCFSFLALSYQDPETPEENQEELHHYLKSITS